MKRRSIFKAIVSLAVANVLPSLHAKKIPSDLSNIKWVINPEYAKAPYVVLPHVYMGEKTYRIVDVSKLSEEEKREHMWGRISLKYKTLEDAEELGLRGRVYPYMATQH